MSGRKEDLVLETERLREREARLEQLINRLFGLAERSLDNWQMSQDWVRHSKAQHVHPGGKHD